MLCALQPTFFLSPVKYPKCSLIVLVADIPMRTLLLLFFFFTVHRVGVKSLKTATIGLVPIGHDISWGRTVYGATVVVQMIQQEI